MAMSAIMFFACREQPNPTEISVIELEGPSFANGNGAEITQFLFDGANTGSLDTDRGLFAIH